MRKPTGNGVEWAECSLIIWTGYWVLVLSLILNSSVGLSAGIQFAGDSVPEIPVWILHSAEEDNLSHFDLNIACLCHSINFNDNKHVYHQSQLRKPTGSGVEWTECSLIIGTGYWFKVSSLILDSSVCLLAGIQCAGDSVPEILVRILHSAEEDNYSIELKMATWTSASKLTTTNTKHMNSVRVVTSGWSLIHMRPIHTQLFAAECWELTSTYNTKNWCNENRFYPVLCPKLTLIQPTWSAYPYAPTSLYGIMVSICPYFLIW